MTPKTLLALASVVLALLVLELPLALILALPAHFVLHIRWPELVFGQVFAVCYALHIFMTPVYTLMLTLIVTYKETVKELSDG